MKIKISTILFFLGTLSMTQCANMVTPTGGAKDTTPPKVTMAVPENHSTGFNGKKIEITFDEFVTLDNASQNVLFSPPLKEKPDIKLNNKTVVIKFNEPLSPNTTYTIHFGNAIKDFHEGNLFSNYNYSFSTGETLDTLCISGKVVDAESMKAAENLFVGLYLESDSLFFQPTQRPPDFISKTDKEGRFTVNGLPDRCFLVFALNDVNSNLFYDMPNEEVAFLDTLVPASFKQDLKKVNDTLPVNDTLAVPNDTLPVNNDSVSVRRFDQNALDLILYSFTETDTTQMLLEKKLVEEGMLRFVFRQPADDVSIETPDLLPDTFQLVKVWSATRDTVWWHFTPNVIDSLRVNIQYDTVINDSTRHSLIYHETTPRGRSNPKKLRVGNNLKNNLLMPDEDLVLTFSEPIVNLQWHDTSTFKANDSVTYNAMVFDKADDDGMRYCLMTSIDDSVSYSVNITDSVFYSVRGLTNDSIHLSFKRATEHDFGNIFITVVPPEGTALVVQLKNNQGKVVDTCVVDGEQRVAFRRLMPEKYKLSAIIDSDRNGRWSTGNYHRRFLPETVVDYKDELDLKAGWDIDLEEKWVF